MHQGVCSNFGKDCGVPFRPTGDRRIYCSDCFKSVGGSGKHRPGGRDFRKQSFDKKRMFQAVCANCGKDCEVPFQPSEGKPVFCSDCFKKNDGAPSRRPDQPSGQSKEQHDVINAKLDKILSLLTKPGSDVPAKKEQTAGSKQESKKPVVKKIAVKKSKSKKKK